MPIRRVALFKVRKEEDRQKLLDMYNAMSTKAVKNGRPYIRSIEAGPTQQDARAQGYTVAATSIFESEEDQKYYDEECPAHAEMKAAAKGFVEGMLMVYFAV
ncbi:hypothetical protein IAQ61_011097 [Plenodomus lingam]|uniref:Similar to stress responsive A/B barrel domain-containing protein n=1 Tax=Leptosphaeria maculans (strain JN3 / isolate v23.1.3 / race Av1-4-5-6-7-8) TaxID=985895 RepID=E5AC46_LEPMJ|nr:similar to stress responsive A/B barrel domain-containing protein [Plenodomus lingam JN3]KAH9859316.1 hypothetical protein IAQ61_011097 [Plenodomus lingam]CBY00157.1 similar to stress responsive A/B barrel domain-containing protein [Plenodomus lingam JN3]